MKKLLCLALAVLLLCAPLTVQAAGWYCPSCGRQNDGNFCPSDGTAKPADVGASAPASSSSVRPGMMVRFGRYEQDGITSDGKEPIEWRVLDVQDGRALLISRYVLDGMEFDYHCHNNVQWADSSIRAWLNDNFFYHAFSASEQDAIEMTQLGEGTLDYIFLLSLSDAKWYMPDMADRLCVATPYAIEKIHHQVNGLGENATCRWWLRTIGNQKHTAMYINEYNGNFMMEGLLDAEYPDVAPEKNLYNAIGVRPMMWVYVDAL